MNPKAQLRYHLSCTAAATTLPSVGLPASCAALAENVALRRAAGPCCWWAQHASICLAYWLCWFRKCASTPPNATPLHLWIALDLCCWCMQYANLKRLGESWPCGVTVQLLAVRPRSRGVVGERWDASVQCSMVSIQQRGPAW